MSIFTESIHTLQGAATSLSAFEGKTILAVNVASKCGLTPQYTGLEALQEKYAANGFTVVGFPCNQFGAQEPGSAEEIETFCSTTYGVTFPMMEKSSSRASSLQLRQAAQLPKSQPSPLAY